MHLIYTTHTNRTESEAFKIIRQKVSSYKNTLLKKGNIEKALDTQNQIALHGNIPKAYKPSKFPITAEGNTKLNDEFMQAYNKIFFQHLTKVTAHNTTQLEVLKVKLASIIPQTEKYIASLDLHPHTIARLHAELTQQCKVKNDEEVTPRPEIVKKTKNTGLTKKKPRKRKSSIQPPPTKRPLLDPSCSSSFLSLGPQPNAAPT